MAERQAKDYDETVREAEITNRMKLETERAEELDKKKEEERYADQIRYQQVTKAQILRQPNTEVSEIEGKTPID